MVSAVLSGQLDDVPHDDDPLFHIDVPRSCPGVPEEMLSPCKTWDDREAYDRRARELAGQFARRFDQSYGDKGIAPEVARQCPGKA